MLSMAEEAVVGELVELLYNFLPASRAPATFGSVAVKAGVGDCAAPASTLIAKQQVIRYLLTAVRESRPERFSTLMVEIVRASISYRHAKSNPLRRDEVDVLNQLLLRLKLKIPDLHDPAFLATLPGSARVAITKELSTLLERFHQLHAQTDRQAAGYGLAAVRT
jgi:hypothetical protein